MNIFRLPDLGEGLAEAEIREWYVKAGDIVTVDQPLVSMETAKAIVDVPSPYAGKILTLHGEVNDVIKTGAPFITFELADDMPDKSKGSVVGALPESSAKLDEGNVIIGSSAASKTSIKIMPTARVLANQMGVDISAVKATGPNGLITPQDVKAHLAAHSEHTETLHGVRRMMANAMVKSHQVVVPVTVMEDANISHLPEKFDMTVHLLNAISAGVKAEPALNAWFNGETLEITHCEDVNIGLAADTAEGLFVPVIKQADKQDKTALRERINHFKQGVQDRSLPPSDMQGATIILSNFGMIAGRYATPIIVPPMVAILAAGKSREIAMLKDGDLVAARMLPLSLTFDHRAVTGGEATRFLGAVIKYLES